MKKLPVSLILVLLVSACSNDTSPTPSNTAADETVAAAQEAPSSVPEKSGPRAAPEGETGAELLASQGVVMEFPHEIGYDIMDTSRNGTPRHRVLVEVLGGDFAKQSADFAAALEKIGYRKASESVDGERVEQVQVQEGKPTYYLLMQPAGSGPKLKNPDAVGSIHIMWNKR